jgi:PGAP1-like protein
MVTVPLGTQTFWINVNGDGIRDQVSPSGAGGYEYMVDEVWLESLAPEEYDENFYFWFTAYWPEGFWIPDIYYSWSRVPNLGGYRTYMRVWHGFAADRDYTYEIWGSRNGGGMWAKEWGPITLSASDNAGVAFHTGPYEPQDYLSSMFYLVRLSKPIGNVSIGGVGTAALGASRGTGGLLDAIIPSSGGITVSIKDAADQVLKAGPQIAWEVWDGINRIQAGTTILGGLLDLGINSAGQFQVGVRLDDAGVVWFKVNAQPPPPPRILLLLHGMNSDTFTWSAFVNAGFGGSFTDIAGGIIRGAAPAPNSRGVYCYRVKFGAYESTSTRTGVEGVTALNTPLYMSNYPFSNCGDFQTFGQLGQEVDDAVGALLGRHPGAHIILLGHSRGGLAARTFLQLPNSGPRKGAVLGLITTSSPHLGSRLGRIFDWLNTHPRGPANEDDWEVVDFLRAPTYAGQPKETLDVRRPVIMDVADNSSAMAGLNAPTAVENMPIGIFYGEIVYNRVDFGVLTLSGPRYSVFDGSGLGGVMLDQLSTAAANYILGAGISPAALPGDGLVRGIDQVFTQLPGFAGRAIPRRIVTDREVVHTGAPAQFADLYAQLHALQPNWFP